MNHSNRFENIALFTVALLFLGFYYHLVAITQIFLFGFAGYGMFTLVQTFIKSRTPSPALIPTPIDQTYVQSTNAVYGVNEPIFSMPTNTPSKNGRAKSWIRMSFKLTFIIFAIAIVLPAIGIVLLLAMIMFGGGHMG